MFTGNNSGNGQSPGYCKMGTLSKKKQFGKTYLRIKQIKKDTFLMRFGGT